MIEFIPIAPIMIGMTKVGDSVQKITFEKVSQYLNSVSLSSPVNEIVKTTYHIDKKFLKTANLNELEKTIIESGSSFLKSIGF